MSTPLAYPAVAVVCLRADVRGQTVSVKNTPVAFDSEGVARVPANIAAALCSVSQDYAPQTKADNAQIGLYEAGRISYEAGDYDQSDAVLVRVPPLAGETADVCGQALTFSPDGFVVCRLVVAQKLQSVYPDAAISEYAPTDVKAEPEVVEAEATETEQAEAEKATEPQVAEPVVADEPPVEAIAPVEAEAEVGIEAAKTEADEDDGLVSPADVIASVTKDAPQDAPQSEPEQEEPVAKPVSRRAARKAAKNK